MEQILQINSKRIEQRLAELATIGKIGETGVCRLALTAEDKLGVEKVREWMESIGLSTRIDPCANLIGRLEGKNPEAPVLMIGSHVDSQPYGGRFDGALGVLGGLEAIQTMLENGIEPEMPIELVAFCDEEGSRFNAALFGSRAMVGRLPEDELERTDQQGISRREALRQFGCDPDKAEEAIYPEGSIAHYLELHIEQGPVLEDMGEAIGVVSGIAGPLWLTVELTGFAGHAGSVPMSLRKDALVGAAEVISAVRKVATSEPGAPTVGTVGSLHVFPNSRNIIAEKVVFTIDLRDIDLERRNHYEQEIRAAIIKAAEQNNLEVNIKEDLNSEPRYCAEEIKQIMHAEGEELMGYKIPELMSGPSHDALSLSYVCPYGMIFVRSKDGISHNPLEFSSQEDIALGVELLYRTAVRLATGQ